MKIVALNLNHKASLRAIKPRLVEAINGLRPDALVLNEYVHGETRAPLWWIESLDVRMRRESIMPRVSNVPNVHSGPHAIVGLGRKSPIEAGAA
jgi:hypothetical protein